MIIYKRFNMDKERLIKTIGVWTATIISWVVFFAIVLGGVWLMIYLGKKIVGLLS